MGKIIDALQKAVEEKQKIAQAQVEAWEKTDDSLNKIGIASEALPDILNNFNLKTFRDINSGGIAQVVRNFGAHGSRPSLLSAGVVIEAIRRGIIESEGVDRIKENLRYAGFTDDKIDLMYKIAEFFPSPRDLIEWAGKQVFEKDLVEELRLTDEFEQINLDQWAKSGVTKEQALNFWIAHWRQCSFAQMVEMLQRNVFGSDEAGRKVLELWYRANEIPAYWREPISKIIWTIANRIDARRFWELRVIDDARLRQIYTDLGYRGVNLENQILFAKISVDLPKLFKRYQNGWITIDDVRKALKADGATDEAIEEHIQEYNDNSTNSLTFNQLWLRYENGWIPLDTVKNSLRHDGASDEYIAELLQTKMVNVVASTSKDLTKAELIKAWHNGVITQDELKSDLVRMGYDVNEADIIIAINPPKAAKPVTPTSLQVLVEKVRQIEGFDYTIFTQDIIEQDNKIAALQAELVNAQATGADPALITNLQAEIEGEQLRLKELKQLHSVA